MIQFNEIIKDLRQKNNMSQVELAKELDTSSQYICNIEKGGAISFERFVEIVGILGYEVEIVIKKNQLKINF